MSLTKVSYSMINGALVNVLDYGADPTGSNNSTTALQAANDAAAATGKNVFIPSGTYLCTALTATTSWFGEVGTIIKYSGTAYLNGLITATSIDNIIFQNIIVDGNCSADPIIWNSSNYNSFTGCAGITIVSSDNASIINCHAQNNVQHGFKVDGCTNAMLFNCTTNRNRGNFGDGFYNNSVIGLQLVDCKAYDFTRIGFVVDTYGSSPLTSYDIKMSNCHAEYGHDASVLYGGGEYNSGVWMENTANAELVNVSVYNMTHRGINLCSGVKNNGVPTRYAHFAVNNCQCFNTGIGVQAYSLSSYPVAVTVNNFHAENVSQGTLFVAATDYDSYVCTNSFVSVDFALNVDQTRAYNFSVETGLTVKPLITFANCIVEHQNDNPAKLNAYNSGSSCADVGCWTSENNRTGVTLTIQNVRNVANGTPIWIGIPYLQNTDLYISDSYITCAYASYLATGNVTIDNCHISDVKFGNGSAGNVFVKNSYLDGFCIFGGINIQFENNYCVASSGKYVWILPQQTAANTPSVTVSGCKFNGNLLYAPVLRFGFSTGAGFTAITTDCQFYNSGSPQAGPFITYQTTGAQMLFNGVYKDSTVTNMMDIDSGSSPTALPTGVTSATFH